MIIEQKNELGEQEKTEIMILWNNEYPKSLSHNNIEDFEKYLIELKNQKHLIVKVNEKIEAWAFQFTRKNETWFAIIVSKSIQNKGIGRNLILKLQRHNNNLSGWVIDNDKMLKANQQPYQSPIGFYTKNGFEILPSIRLENEKISAVKIKWSSK